MNRLSPDQLSDLRQIAGILSDKVKVIDTFAHHLNPAPGYPTHKETILSYLDDAKDLSGRLVRALAAVGLQDVAVATELCGRWTRSGAEGEFTHFRCEGCGAGTKVGMGEPDPIQHWRPKVTLRSGGAVDASRPEIKDAPRGVPTA